MFKQEPCPQCGDYVDEVWWGNVIEFISKPPSARLGYNAEQTCTISCSNCNFSIAISVDPNNLKPGDSQKIEQVLKETWNKMYEVSK